MSELEFQGKQALLGVFIKRIDVYDAIGE